MEINGAMRSLIYELTVEKYVKL